MKKYAIIEDGVVANIVEWDGESATWQPPEGTHAQLVPEGVSVCIGWTYLAKEGFVAPAPPPVPLPTAAEALARRDALLALATLRIDPLQDAVDLGVETGDEVALLTEWKHYRVDLSRIEQQPGFPGDVEWPVAPQ